MQIPILALLFLYTTALMPAELSTPKYRRIYTPEQLTSLATIRAQWEIWQLNMPVKRWNLMEEGINAGLHPDDINDTFLMNMLQEAYPSNDPHEAVLRKVEFLLHHNANPNDPPELSRPPTSLRVVTTFAMARCLLDHKAQAAGEEDETLLHWIANKPRYTSESAKSLIALYCSVGVRPDVRCRGATALAFLAYTNFNYDAHHYRIVADTLVKVGTPIDDAFEKVCIMTKSRKPAVAPLVEAIHNAAYKAREEVTVVKEKLQSQHDTLLVVLLKLTNLSEDTARIVTDYAYNLNPHDYFIQKILTEADAQLQRERAERERARNSSWRTSVSRFFRTLQKWQH